MTGFMHENEFSRKTFLKGGGALVVGFSLAGAGLAGKASAADSPYASNAPYDPMQLDSWIVVHADNTASIKSGRLELGQGTSTGLLLIAGEELDMDLSQLKFINVDTNVVPDTGGTYGSSSIRQAGPPVRAAAAYAKQTLVGLAATQLGVPVSSLSVKSGVVSGGGKTVTYGALLGDKLFKAQLGATTRDPGQAPAKAPSAYTLVGTSPPRIDIPDKVTGTYTYIHSVRVPGMLHGRIVRPRGQGGYGTGAKPLSVDAGSIKHIPNVQIVRKGDFLGVVAPKEYDAIQAAAQIKVVWEDKPILAGDGNVYGAMRAQDKAGMTQNSLTVTGSPDAALASAAKVVSATYTYDYQSHAPIAPTCLIADATPNGCLILTSSQDSYLARTRLAAVLGMSEKVIRFKYFEGGGAFGGHPGRYDAPPAAAIMSMAVGKPVRLQYMRWDEHGWDSYGPTQLTDVRAGIDASGKIVAYDNTVWTMPSGAKVRETTEEVSGMGPLSATELGVSNGNTGPALYAIPNRRGAGRSVPVLNGGYLKTAPLRSPGSPTNFPAEQMIDELAYAAKMDPIAFRIQNISASANQRSIDALNNVAKISKWETRPSASKLSNANVVRGRGVAASGTVAVVAEIEVNKKTGKILVKHMYGVQDSGLSISPGLMENQMSGSLIQTASRAVLEGVRYTKSRVTSLDWVSYPIMRFKEHPAVTTVVISRPDVIPSGAGEQLVPGTPAAIANAFFDATGVRIRQVPMTAGRVRATLKAAGVS
jgi:nicotinate dehydrogenase subunit B